MIRFARSLAPLLLVFAACADPYGAEGHRSSGPDEGSTGGVERGGAPGDTAPSPSSATVRVHYPAGTRAMTLTGDAAPLAPNTPIALAHVGDDTWELTMTAVTAPLHVKPMLDGTPCRGPSYVVHPGKVTDIYPHFSATRGKVINRWAELRSKVHPLAGGVARPIEVYLPPSYEENTVARYPVVYMMDGQIVFGSSTVVVAAMGDMKVDEALDVAAESGAVAETIVVAIDSPINLPPDVMADRNYELTPTSAVDPKNTIMRSGAGPAFLSMIVTELKPMVDAELRTRPGRESTFIAGASLGGLMSVYAGVTHGDVFGGIAALSASAFWDDSMIIKKVRDAKIGPKQASRVYADVGGGEVIDGDTIMLTSNEALFQAYAEAGYADGVDLKTMVEPGATHHGDDWAKRIPGAFAFVVGPGR